MPLHTPNFSALVDLFYLESGLAALWTLSLSRSFRTPPTLISIFSAAGYGEAGSRSFALCVRELFSAPMLYEILAFC